MTCPESRPCQFKYSWCENAAAYVYFHGRLDMSTEVTAPVLWLSGLPGPPEDSLKVPRDVGLLGPVGPAAAWGLPGVNGSVRLPIFCSLRFSAIKLPTITCHTQESYYQICLVYINQICLVVCSDLIRILFAPFFNKIPIRNVHWNFKKIKCFR